MKSILFVLAIFIFAVRLPAQTNAPVRLALVSESDEASVVVDVLTAELSGHKNLELLERNAVDKVYREQGLSAGNRDYLKIGQILGADGLLLLDVVRTSQATNLMTRLIAVKPGVILTDGSFAWPLKDTAQWAESLSSYLDLLLPKLSVPAKDAIPISVVNLRSAVASAEGAETEQQLKLLVIQRLSQEKELFVLERQKMQLLSEEKILKADDSAFWNGSYLLEGVVDQSGYSKETITVNAKLTPPKGGTPLPFAVSGSRTNLAEVINQLADKVNKALKLSSAIKEWNAADEAAQYFAEAQWALRWGAYGEAQAAADSAWALGKRDLDCAIVRIKSYECASVPLVIGEVGSIGRSIIDSGNEADRQATIKDINKIFAIHPGAVFAFGIDGLEYVAIDTTPSAGNLEWVNHALELYDEFSHTMPEGEPKADSAWYALGVECLTAAAQVLQHYYLVPKSQGDMLDKLSELRATARSVVGWISQSPSVHNSYFAANPDGDKERGILIYDPNIYYCKVNWGCFWQETPEDCIALYRDLLSSPAFSCFTDEIGGSPAQISESRGLEQPLIVAWNEAGRKQIPVVWDGFIRELNDSTNQYLNEMGGLFSGLHASGVNEAEIIAQYNEYWRTMQFAKRNVLTGGKQIEYLKANYMGDITSLVDEFLVTESTRNHALEIQPLLAAYQANLVVQLGTKSGMAAINLKYAIKYVESAQAIVDRILNKGVQTNVAAIRPSSPPLQADDKSLPTVGGMAATILHVENYLPMPKTFPRDKALFEEDKTWGLRIVSSRWVSGKLVMDLRYHCEMHVNGGGDVTKEVAVIFDPVNESWKTLEYPPEAYDRGYPRWPDQEVSFEIYHDDFYFSDGGQIQKYDLINQQWESFQVPGLNNSKLFVVEGHFYAVNSRNILEIIENGKSSRILISTRRRPAVSALDLLDNLGSPELLAGPDSSLRLIIGSKIYSWDGKDWQEMFDFGFGTGKPRLDYSEGAVLARPDISYDGQTDETLWVLQKDQTRAELCLYKKAMREWPPTQNQKLVGPTPHPLWQFPEGDSLMNLAATYFKSNLYFFDDRANRTTSPSGQGTTVSEKDGSARLVCFSHDCSEPIVLSLKFDWQQGRPPLSKQAPWSAGDTWMQFVGDALYIGQPDTPGIWMVPVREVEAAISEQSKILRKKEAEASQIDEDRHRNLLLLIQKGNSN